MYTFYIAILIICLFVELTLGILAWKRYRRQLRLFFAAVLCNIALTTLSFILMYLSPTPEIGFLWARLRYTVIALVPITFLAAVWMYLGHDKRITRRIVFLVLPYLLIVALIWTNDLHHWFLTSWEAVNQGGLLLDSPHYNVGYWLNVGYQYMLVWMGSLLIARQLFVGGNLFRSQTLVLLFSLIISVTTTLVSVLGLLPQPSVSLIPIGYCISSVVLSWAVFNRKLFDIMPIAQSTIFANMHDGLIVLDSQNNVVEVNPAALQWLGKSAAQVIGQTTFNLFAEYEMLKPYEGVFEAHEEIMVGHDDQQRFYDLTIAPLRHGHNLPLGKLLTLHDGTERKTAAMQRERLIESLEAYAHTVAHDLKNPLAMIIGFSHLLETADDLTEARSLAARVVTASYRMDEIVESLLLFAQVENTVSVPSEPLDMPQLVENALEKLEYTITKSQAKVIVAPALPPAYGQPIWIEQVWVNYISNAIKYGGKLPCVEIGAVLEDTQVRYWVRDNGHGISPEQQTHLFKRFSRLEQHEGTKGHGIGLAVIRDIVEKLGGHVGVESSVGSGSTFYFMLPTQSVADGVKAKN